MARHFWSLLATLFLVGCAHAPPAVWSEVCKQDAGLRVLSKPSPDGLALPYHGSSADQVLVESGAAWVEYSNSAVGGRLAEVFRGGPGRYKVRLAHLDSVECRHALRVSGYDPATLKRNGSRDAKDPGALFGIKEYCIDAERLGDRVDPPLTLMTAPQRREFLDRWSAPYILIGTSEEDARSTPDFTFWRLATSVIRRDTGEVVAESVKFSYQHDVWPGWPGGASCNASSDPWTEGRLFEVIPVGVFSR